ncbi:hypothetical protein SCUP515_05064 [Seiridium cupressi]
MSNSRGALLDSCPPGPSPASAALCKVLVVLARVAARLREGEVVSLHVSRSVSKTGPDIGDDGKHVFKNPAVNNRNSIDDGPGYGDEGRICG